MKSISKTLKVIVINGILILVLLVIVDLCLDSQSVTIRNILMKELTINSDTLQTPTDSYMKSTDGLEQNGYRLRVTDDGFIIGENNLHKVTDSVDIIFFGGSTTETLYVEESKRFPYLIQEKLSDSLNKSITTLNAGVSGNNSLHSTLNLLAKGVDKNPKVVVLMHNINDLVGLIKTKSYHIHPKSRNPIQEIEVSNNIKNRAKSIKNAFLPNLYPRLKILGNALKLIVNPNCKSCIKDEWKGYRNGKNYSYEIIEKEFEKSILSFINIAKSHNITPIIMTQFNRINSTDSFVLRTFPFVTPEFSEKYHKINNKIRAIAKDQNIGLIDLAKLVPNTKEYIYDDIHLNTNGSIFVSNIITNYLLKNNTLN